MNGREIEKSIFLKEFLGLFFEAFWENNEKII